MRVLVTGGRTYNNYHKLAAVLSEIHDEYVIDLLVHGAAPGADSLAETWAKENEVPYFGIPARWKTGTRGKGEGPYRNGLMLSLTNPDLVVQFAGGRGTQNCVLQAHKAGIEVREVLE